jgi:hypothetical protein
VSSEQPEIFRSQFGSNRAVLYKAKRQKYLPIAFEGYQDISNTLSDALSGNGQWLSAPGPLNFAQKQEDL